MADKLTRLSDTTWKRAKVAAAEADVPLRVFIDRAVGRAVDEHERRKRDEVRVAPVEFVGKRS